MEALLRGLTGLKDEGVENAGERAEDTGTATLKFWLKKRGGNFVTTLRKVESCMTRWYDSQMLVCVWRSGCLHLDLWPKTGDSFPLLPRHVEGFAEVKKY